MASTSVVLPWSTWAMMATLRISGRVFTGEFYHTPARRATESVARPRQREPKSRNFVRLALIADAAAHEGDELGTDVEAQPNRGVAISTDAPKTREELMALVLRHAGAFVLHRERDAIVVGFYLNDDHRVRRRVFRRVGQHVRQHLHDAAFVGAHARQRRKIERAKLAFGVLALHARNRFFHDENRIDVLKAQREFTGIHAREQQEIFEDRRETSSRCAEYGEQFVAPFFR